jgi:hypothetical protein
LQLLSHNLSYEEAGRGFRKCNHLKAKLATVNTGGTYFIENFLLSSDHWKKHLYLASWNIFSPTGLKYPMDKISLLVVRTS